LDPTGKNARLPTHCDFSVGKTREINHSGWAPPAAAVFGDGLAIELAETSHLESLEFASHPTLARFCTLETNHRCRLDHRRQSDLAKTLVVAERVGCVESDDIVVKSAKKSRLTSEDGDVGSCSAKAEETVLGKGGFSDALSN
jgi:hypothetical protein